MLDLFRSSFRLKSSSLRKKLEDAEEEVPSENDCKKILKVHLNIYISISLIFQPDLDFGVIVYVCYKYK